MGKVINNYQTIFVTTDAYVGDWSKQASPCVVEMVAGRVRAGKAFTRPRAYPCCRPVPAREHTCGRKILPVPAPGGYPRVSGLPAPAAAALPHASPLPWALPPPLLRASWPSKPTRPPLPRPSSSLSWPPPPPCRCLRQIRPPLLMWLADLGSCASASAHERLSSSACVPVLVCLPRSGADGRQGVELEG
jgi:hypothetical protein